MYVLRDNASRWRPNKLKYTGALEECPIKFLDTFNCEMRTEQLKELDYIGDCLRDEAGTWYKTVGKCVESWSDFQENFLNIFNSVKRQNMVLSKIFSESQRSGEGARAFAQRQIALYKRLKATAMSEVDFCDLIIGQMKNEFRRPFLWNKPESIRHLLNCLYEVDDLEKTVQRPARPAVDNRPRRPAVTHNAVLATPAASTASPAARSEN